MYSKYPRKLYTARNYSLLRTLYRCHSLTVWTMRLSSFVFTQSSPKFDRKRGSRWLHEGSRGGAGPSSVIRLPCDIGGRACNFHAHAIRHIRHLLTTDLALTLACSLRVSAKLL